MSSAYVIIFTEGSVTGLIPVMAIFQIVGPSCDPCGQPLHNVLVYVLPCKTYMTFRSCRYELMSLMDRNDAPIILAICPPRETI